MPEPDEGRDGGGRAGLLVAIVALLLLSLVASCFLAYLATLIARLLHGL